MPAHARLIFPGLLVTALLLSACFPPFGPFFPMPPMGEAELVVENATDENWVLRVLADGYPLDYAVPAGETGTGFLYAGQPTSFALLDPDCQQVDELEWTDAPQAVRIEFEGQLSAIDIPSVDDAGGLAEFFECSGGFGPSPVAGNPVIGAPGTLLLTGAEGKGWQINVATADLGQITAGASPSSDADHQLSPDGTRLAFTRYSEVDSSSDLFVAETDGSDERLLVEDASTPAWSPDGTRIAYLSLDPFAGGATINVIDLAGGEPIELAEDALAPRWSLDGERIAFMSVDVTRFNQPTIPPSELRIVNADGTGLETLAEGSPFADRPAWSPDGSQIAFTAGSETEGTLAVADLDSGEATTVAEVGSGAVTEPTWSPDGERIAFAISSFTIFSSGAAVGIVPAAGGDVERIGALSDAYVASPIWSPDGAWLAFVRSAAMELTSELIVFELESEDETILANGVLSLSSWRD